MNAQNNDIATFRAEIEAALIAARDEFLEYGLEFEDLRCIGMNVHIDDEGDREVTADYSASLPDDFTQMLTDENVPDDALSAEGIAAMADEFAHAWDDNWTTSYIDLSADDEEDGDDDDEGEDEDADGEGEGEGDEIFGRRINEDFRAVRTFSSVEEARDAGFTNIISESTGRRLGGDYKNIVRAAAPASRGEE